jgi:hypothetical protein
VSRWVSAATAGSGTRVLHQIATPEWQSRANSLIAKGLVMMADREPVTAQADQCSVYVTADGDLLDAKYRAMLCQQSQVGPLLALAGPDRYRAMLAEEAFTDERPQLPLSGSSALGRSVSTAGPDSSSRTDLR